MLFDIALWCVLENNISHIIIPKQRYFLIVYLHKQKGIEKFHGACRWGLIDLLPQLIQNVDIRAKNDFAFRFTCIGGYINIAKLLLYKDPTINIHANKDEAFTLTGINNHSGTMKWLIGLEPKYGKIDIHQNDDIIYRIACAKNYKKVLFLLYKLKDTHGLFDIHACYEDAFLSACMNGNFDLIIWLWDLSLRINDKINLRINNDMSFKLACEYGWLLIVEWLLLTESNIDIHANDDEAIKGAFRNKHMHVVEWLCNK